MDKFACVLLLPEVTSQKIENEEQAEDDTLPIGNFSLFPVLA